MLDMVKDLSLSTKPKSSNGSGLEVVELENIISITRNKISSAALAVEVPMVRTKNKLDIVEISITVSKAFSTQNCALCLAEKVEVIKFFLSDPSSLINKSHEINGTCRHRILHNHAVDTDDVTKTEIGLEPDN